GFFEGDERFARNPAVLGGELPALAVFFAQADEDVDAVVLHVERLPAALDAVAENGDGLVAQDGLDAFRRKVGPFDDVFRAVADLNLSHGESFLSESRWY